MNVRLLAMIVKEAWAVLRDPRARITLFIPPILQLVLFSAAATLEVRNVTLGIYDRDGGAAASEFVNQLAGSPNIRELVRVGSPDEMRRLIGRQQVIGVLIFDAGFSGDVAAHRPASAQLLLDGRRSNAAQIVATYVDRIAQATGVALSSARAPPEPVVVTNWFNPNLDYLWFIMPSLVVTVVSISALAVTAQSVARERELGTFDQLMVSPLRTWEILIGKMVPPFVVGLINGTIFLILIPTVYGVPFTGSLALFYLTLAVALLAIMGIGMVVSALSATQQQAFLGMFLVTVPMTLLSGFASPIDNMPVWLQWVAEANPQKHFLILSEGLFLKGLPARDLFDSLWPMALIAAVTLTASTLLFRSRME
jgi:ABC-2 type transport system permease protein